MQESDIDVFLHRTPSVAASGMLKECQEFSLRIFPLIISSANAIKSVGSCEFGLIY